MKNYKKLETKFIKEIQSNVTIYSHNKTKARICTIENDDTNKVFSIAFRTPPINNTGLTHILEHSVLCGSKKYPVKDPFVELLKSSLNTFLNAFTYPDKTVYPCASQNNADFKNLMSIYMDAVFYPQIYKHEEIFMQEGWHYHILDENDSITYNGVVYNEMKGAFSDPEQILMRNLMHSLYPDVAYGYESGGDPKYIPDLNYEEFKEFHKKYYHPSNSYIFLYGDCDMEERLKWLDEEYLSKFNEIEFDTRILPQKAFDKPIYQTGYYPISKEDKVKDKTFLSYNIVLPTTLDIKQMIAVSILVAALFDNPGAPLKQALIDAKLGQDVETIFDDGLLQPLLAIILLNSNEDKEKEFIHLIDTKLKETVASGLDKEMLLSIINYQEFKARERGFSSRFPQGLEIELNCLNSWLYSDEHPFSKLEVLQYYDELKKDIENNYFEQIIENMFINNTHKAYVKLIPSHTCGKALEDELIDKLKKYKESLSKEELKELINKNKNLEKYQSTPSTKEEIDSLPKLRQEDISTDVEKLNCEKLNHSYPILYSNYYTNDIAYIKYYFDCTSINKMDLQYLSLFTDLFTYLSTENNSYQNIHQLMLKRTGGIHASVYPYNTINRECRVLFRISYSALTEQVEAANEIIEDLLNHTNYSDEKRLYERLCEIKLSKEMGISNRGHIVALMRSGSYCDDLSYINDQISGIAYMDFLSNLIEKFEECKEIIKDKLNSISSMIFSQEAFTLGFTGTKEQLDKTILVYDNFYKSLEKKSTFVKEDYVKEVLNEGIKTQFDVNFVARTGCFKEEFHGAMLVLNNALSLDYLWQKVRVHGGAYGCMMQIKPSGFIGFTSYRDPELARTEKVYEESIKYIENLNPTDEELLKFKIGAIGNMDTVMHVSEKASTAQQQYFSQMTYEMRKRIREEAINATKKELNSFAKIFASALEQRNICVIGNTSKIENNVKLFNNTRNLIK